MTTIAATAAASHACHSLLAPPPPLKPSFPKSHSLKPSFSKSPSRTRSLIKAEIEIRVCVNKSCSRLGSRQTLETLSDLAPPDVTVKSCGCLGRCGAGPNLVVLPEAAFIGHCGTAARASELMASLCGGGWDPSKNLAALALRKKGEGELEKGNYSEAEVLLSQAIDLKPSGGLHIIHKCRSAARLALGNYSSALEDAKEASRIAPSYPQAYICQGDAFFAMDEFGEAENAYSHALSVDPSIRRSKSFKSSKFQGSKQAIRLSFSFLLCFTCKFHLAGATFEVPINSRVSGPPWQKQPGSKENGVRPPQMISRLDV